jgi:Tfp pilus assembly protein PilF
MVLTYLPGIEVAHSGMETMRRIFSWPLAVMFLTATAAAAQDNPSQSGQSPPATPTTTTPEITVTGTVPSTERALPPLPPNEFTDCVQRNGFDAVDMRDLAICEAKLSMEKHTVIERCINRNGKSAPPAVVQACTESLDRRILEGSERYFLFVNRAEAYVAEGDKQRALDDYNEAVNLAPKNAKLYYNRAVFYAAQPDGDSALRDFDTALSINPKLVAALQERAKLYQTQNNFSGAIADCSEAIRLQPKTAALWSERGQMFLLQHDYESALKDETQAIQVDSKLARAYFFRAAAYFEMGDSPHARSDLVIAVRLDPSLERYVTVKRAP